MKQLPTLHRTGQLAATLALGLAVTITTAAPGQAVSANAGGIQSSGSPSTQQITLRLRFPGGYVTVPATRNRVVPSGAGATAEIELNGPVDIHYVDPASDPRNRSRDLVTELGLTEMIRAISYPQ